VTADDHYGHIERTYDEGAREYGLRFREPHAFIDAEREAFVARLSPGSRILDCGCGPGMDSERFDRLGYRVTAIDFADAFVNLARRRAPGVDVCKMDMRSLDFADASFDGVWAAFSLLHLRARELPDTLTGFTRVLGPEGLLFAGLHRGAKTRWVKTRISETSLETYVQEWRQDEIEGTVRAAGFEILSSRPFERKEGLYPLLSILARSARYRL
jgi:ubiquinone/menaquinone biosynthesis C-methylase UbiE